MGTAFPVHVSFEWGLTDSYGNETSPTWPAVSTGPFNWTLTGLRSDITYHYRAKAVGHGTDYGDDRTFIIPAQPPDQPPNILPGPGTPCVPFDVVLQSGAFYDNDFGDTHQATQWQVRTSGGAPGSAYDNVTYEPNLTSVTLTTGELAYDTEYLWRVRHQDSKGVWSQWSTETSFKTADTLVGQPRNVVRDGTDITFDWVTYDGCTWVTKSNVTPGGHSEPRDIRIGPFVDIRTTAEYSDTITVGLGYPPIVIGPPEGKPGYTSISLYHWNGTSWENITTTIDYENRVIYGEVTSLSWFYVGGNWVYSQGVPIFPNVYAGIAAAFGAVACAYFIRRRIIQPAQ
jgi:hypothetical protein